MFSTFWDYLQKPWLVLSTIQCIFYRFAFSAELLYSEKYQKSENLGAQRNVYTDTYQ